jgi:hypothetical protein
LCVLFQGLNCLSRFDIGPPQCGKALPVQQAPDSGNKGTTHQGRGPGREVEGNEAKHDRRDHRKESCIGHQATCGNEGGIFSELACFCRELASGKLEFLLDERSGLSCQFCKQLTQASIVSLIWHSTSPPHAELSSTPGFVPLGKLKRGIEFSGLDRSRRAFEEAGGDHPDSKAPGKQQRWPPPSKVLKVSHHVADVPLPNTIDPLLDLIDAAFHIVGHCGVVLPAQLFARVTNGFDRGA